MYPLIRVQILYIYTVYFFICAKLCNQRFSMAWWVTGVSSQWGESLCRKPRLSGPGLCLHYTAVKSGSLGGLCLYMNYIVSSWVSRVWQIHFNLLSIIKYKSLGFSLFCCKYINESHIKAGDDCQHLIPNYLFLNPLSWSVQIISAYWPAVSLWPSFDRLSLSYLWAARADSTHFLVADNWDQEHPRVTTCLRDTTRVGKICFICRRYSK